LNRQYSLEPIQVLLVSYKGEKIDKPSRIGLAEIEKDLTPALAKYCRKRLKRKETE
jgi:tRNA A37 threonylcarbamoyladenosine dehydratase